MTTYGLPYFFEDTSGLPTGPTDFLDIYDRPPFLRVTTSHPPSLKGRPTLETSRDGRTLKIFELGSNGIGFRRNREEGTPSAVVTVDSPSGLSGTVKLYGGQAVPLEKWLKKASTFGSTLLRQFRGTDGLYYQWRFRTQDNHEWACVQLQTNIVVAHYDVRSPAKPVYRTSGNVLTIYENCVHMSVEILASLVVMRHLQAFSKQ
ncbi:hypothetical protein M422DRAFT_31679 [Sphaerobolus stellatus SS14]|uniref:Unplaced genomic scaffold SPHSTscaffold_163, whole genome shotgun sequence n=1 Tax=Sphaerobolus stellatus (strain SS14) TaxID=990650 RepID=A0A0C9TNQ6_SPHS4|nr:hypothetical protein M422DRAFT_36124 [Sphaerobolus stellatus SS14]KIJ41720.1 hypothetical protein M422DRAFT_31679 [Sphaerobolus stellatus SS14]